MERIPAPADALFVLDGANASRTGMATAQAVLGSDIRWTIVCVIPEHPRLTSGATGFAGPVLSPDDMDTMATAGVIAGDAAAAATASGLGDRPVTQAVVRGDLGTAVAAYLHEHPADVVVVDSPDLAQPLAENGIPAVLVVTALAT